jgi:hypothetical protein
MNRRVNVRVDADVSGFNRAMLAASASSQAFANSLDSSRNQMSGLIQAGLALGPALVPVGAAAVPVISGLANQLGIAAGAAGVTAVAFNGVGTALQDLNDYRLKPTNANLLNLQNSMASIGPAGREFVTFLQGLRPEVERLQNIAQDGMFPGLTQGLKELGQNKGLIEEFFATTSQTIGDLFAEAGDNLNDPRWQEFFAFLNREAKPTLEAMARTLGNFAEGFAQMWMAFEPLNDRFSAGFLQMSRDFAEWSSNLSTSGGFQDFVAYLERTGPMVADFIGSMTDAFVELAKAGAVVGDVALPALTLLFDAIAGLMSSPIGAPLLGLAAGIAAVSTALRIAKFGNFAAIAASVRALRDMVPVLGAATRSWLAYDVAAGRAMGKQGPIRDGLKQLAPSIGKTGAVVAGLAFTMSDLDDKMGLTHASSFALAAGFATGSPLGAAIGFAVGATIDLANANDDLHAAVDRAAAAAGNSSVSYKDQAAAIAVAKQKLEELRAAENAYSNPAGGGGSIGDRIKGAKSLIEGLFGKSDSEEAAAGIRAAEAETAKQKAAELGLSTVYANGTQKIRDRIAAIYDKIAAQRAEVQATHEQIGGEIAYEAAVDSANKTIKENGHNTDIGTQKGRENVQAVNGIIDAWNALTPAGQKARGGMEAARAALIRAATAAGYSKGEIRKLLRELLDLSNVDPSIDVTIHGVDRVKAALRQIAAQIRRMPRSVPINAGVFGLNKADGGIVDYYGLGGLRESHIAQIAPKGTTRVWNEPETQGEAYIPLANDWRRPRALDIWAATGSRLGVQGFADGGFNGVGPMDGWYGLDEKALERAFTRALSGSRFALDKDHRNLQLTTRRGG